MPVKVRCTSCDKILIVPDAARGKAVKCPECDEKFLVPTQDSGAQKVVKSDGNKSQKKPAAKSVKPIEDESGIVSLDLRRVEDANARICPKCGFDMQELDEEETECPKCGFDAEAGGLGVKARKKRMKGPDPADFYPDLVKNAWNFVMKNQMLAWRTDLYTFICLLLSSGCAFMFLWISAWPPRAFFGLCFFVSILVIPGWLWVLDTEVIKLTLEKKEKFKKLNFDFFHASASGIMSVAWLAAVGGPILLVPGGIGYYLVHNSGQPPWVLAVFLGVGLIPVLWMLPVGMAHMTMPIPTPGWMVWKVATIWSRTVPALSVWLLWLFLTTLPLIGAAAVVGAVWGNDLANLVQTMESNAKTNRDRLAAANAPKNAAVDLETLGEVQEVNFTPLIGPSIILAVMCLPLGFIAMFNMRTNGLFVYYFKDRLELIDKKKEYKYVAKERRGEDEEDAPPSIQKDIQTAVVGVLVIYVFGGVLGMVMKAIYSSDIPMFGAVMFGILYAGCGLSLFVGHLLVIIGAFKENAAIGCASILPGIGELVCLATIPERTRGALIFMALAFVCAVPFVILALMGLIALGLAAQAAVG